MAVRITQLVAAEGWFAVFARASSASAMRGGSSRATGPVAEFLPLVAWALIFDEARATSSVVGLIAVENHHVELVLDDDPGFLGYAGPGDPGVDRTSLTPDWRAMAREAIAMLRRGPHATV